jgi:hypothetical protein
VTDQWGHEVSARSTAGAWSHLGEWPGDPRVRPAGLAASVSGPGAPLWAQGRSTGLFSFPFFYLLFFLFLLYIFLIYILNSNLVEHLYSF